MKRKIKDILFGGFQSKKESVKKEKEKKMDKHTVTEIKDDIFDNTAFYFYTDLNDIQNSKITKIEVSITLNSGSFDVNEKLTYTLIGEWDYALTRDDDFLYTLHEIASGMAEQHEKMRCYGTDFQK